METMYAINVTLQISVQTQINIFIVEDLTTNFINIHFFQCIRYYLEIPGTTYVGG